uniref:Sodium/hydrogen exchanger 8 n=1 Tax=Plectus sambesii TaxID=2011161 RepID=A0A914UWW3_9BILA
MLMNVLLSALVLGLSVLRLDAQVVASGGTEEQMEQKSGGDAAQPAAVGDNDAATLSSDNNITDILNATVPTTIAPPALNGMPDKESQAQEHKSSMAIFFILFVIILSILLVHVLIVTKFRYIPESLAIVLFGALIGFVLSFSNRDWKEEEALKPNAFFLVLLPPIIFESGYNLNKGNFFANIGSILVFAILGTVVSACVVGGGIYILGQADLIYSLSAVNSFAFGSMISAVDPVATLAIFQALNVDSLLYMLVFGESVLNDAVAIVLATTVLELNEPAMASLTTFDALSLSFRRFMLMFFGSAALGVAAGLASALLLKHVDLRKTPSLEFGVMLVFAYLPYGLAEGVHLSGIMAILFCGIAMSHYTHFNLSPMTQITMQQTFRTLAFIA